MNNLFRSGFLIALLALPLAPMKARATEPEPSPVTVEWTNPEEFTEVRYDRRFRAAAPTVWLGEFRRELVRRGEKLLQPGQQLRITITDVKLAGKTEPWHGLGNNDIRIVRPIYPPRINLFFELRDASGTVIANGERKLRDPGFLDRDIGPSHDPYRFCKRLLTDWLRKEFAGSTR